MNIKKAFAAVACCSAFGLVACGGDSSSSAGDTILDEGNGEAILSSDDFGNPDAGYSSDSGVPGVDNPNPGVGTISSSSVQVPGNTVNSSSSQGTNASTSGSLLPGHTIPLDSSFNNFTLPANANSEVTKKLYDTWKANFVVKLSEEKAKYPKLGAQFDKIFGSYIADGKDPARVIWQTSSNEQCRIDEAEGTPMYRRGCTVSEGIGYGMMISVLMDDMETYNGIWYYSHAYRRSVYAGNSETKPGLMPWLTSTFNWGKDGILDNSSATDADLDIAASLVIAWLKTGKEEYKADALTLINALWNTEINQSNLLIYSGDTPMWHKETSAYNLCYFSPVAIRLFAMVDPSHNWKGVLDAMYTYMAKVQAAGTGVFPDWSDVNGVAMDPKNGSATKTYWTFNKEAVRIPWRIAWDFMWFPEGRSAQVLNTLNSFISEKSNGDVNAIPAVNYSWNLGIGADVTGSSLPTQWLAAWCVTGVAKNSEWTSKCLDRLNTVEMQTSASSYFSNILHMIYSQLLNGYYAKPTGI